MDTGSRVKFICFFTAAGQNLRRPIGSAPGIWPVLDSTSLLRFCSGLFYADKFNLAPPASGLLVFLSPNEAGAVGANFGFHFVNSASDDFAIIGAILFEPFSSLGLVGQLVKFV